MSEEDAAQTSAPFVVKAAFVPVESMLYYYGNISRETAEWILWDRGCQDGMYLVRESSGDYVLSLCYQKSILHYRIKRLPGGDVGLCGVPHQLFPGPVELVKGVEGLACKPLIPCNKSLDAILPLTHWGLTQDEIRQAIIRKGLEWGLNETELMLSMSEEHNDVKHLIIKTLHEIQPWFHGQLSREQAEKALLESGLRDGKFLVRERNDSSYAFCLSHCGKIKHYKIDVLPSGEFAIQDGQRFPSIIALVSHYSLFSDGLWCALTEPCDNRTTTTTSTSSTSAASHSSIKQANHLNKQTLNLPSSPNLESGETHTSNSSSSSSIHSTSSSSIVQSEIRAKNNNMEVGRPSSRPSSSPSSPGGSTGSSTPFSSAIKVKSNPPVAIGGGSGNQKGIFTKLMHTVSGFESQSNNTSPAKHSSSSSNEGLNITLTPQKRKTSCSSVPGGQARKETEDLVGGTRRHSGAGGTTSAKPMQKATSFDLIPAFLSALLAGNDAKDCSGGGKLKKRTLPPSGPPFEIEVQPNATPARKSEFYVSTPNSSSDCDVSMTKLCNNNKNKLKAATTTINYANKKDVLNGAGRSLSLGETESGNFHIETSSIKSKDNDSLIFIRSASSPSVVVSTTQGAKQKSTPQHDNTTILKTTSKNPSTTQDEDDVTMVVGENLKGSSSPIHQKQDVSDTPLINTSPKNNTKEGPQVVEDPEEDLIYFDFDENEEGSGGSSSSSCRVIKALPSSPLRNDYLSADPLNNKSNDNCSNLGGGGGGGISTSESSEQLDIYATLSDTNTLQGTLKRNKQELGINELDQMPDVHPAKLDWHGGSFLSQEESELAYQTLRRHRRGPVSLDPTAIVLNDKIGSGNFGEVWCGSFKSGSLEVLFAVKMLKSSASHQKSEILSEAHTMAALDHPHIVRLIGVCDSDPFMLVMELAPLGPLNKFLKAHRDTSLYGILMLMLQVTNAMEFLESEQFVHRDLAARNVLLVNENFAKISDFGMSRALGFGKEYYRAETPGKWPLKWYAPECIYYFKFSTKSDVWSFGVTLWEAMSYGSKPYQGLTGGDILQMFDRSERLPKPKLCPDEVYDIMLKCWNYRPEDRPDFSLLHELLKQCAASYKCR